MRVFVSEYLTCGACVGQPMPQSLLREGRAMLEAVLADFAHIDGCEVVTTCDGRLGPPADNRVQYTLVDEPAREPTLFRHLAAECDATLVVAPEFDGLLSTRRKWVDEAGGRFLGCSLAAIELCSDKLLLARTLIDHDISTITTIACDLDDPQLPVPLPAVVKPRDGAGSQHTFLVRDAAQLKTIREQLIAECGGSRPNFVCQPYVRGLPASAAALISNDSARIDVMPVGAQLIADDGRFTYLGGRIPLPGPIRSQPEITQRDVQSAVERTVELIGSSVPGLAGYVGFDFVLPDDSPLDPVLVEINPRLTTSYIGYRRLTHENLAERILRPREFRNPIGWLDTVVHFSPDGSIRTETPRSPNL